MAWAEVFKQHRLSFQQPQDTSQWRVLINGWLVTLYWIQPCISTPLRPTPPQFPGHPESWAWMVALRLFHSPLWSGLLLSHLGLLFFPALLHHMPFSLSVTTHNFYVGIDLKTTKIKLLPAILFISQAEQPILASHLFVFAYRSLEPFLWQNNTPLSSHCLMQQSF